MILYDILKFNIFPSRYDLAKNVRLADVLKLYSTKVNLDGYFNFQSKYLKESLNLDE